MGTHATCSQDPSLATPTPQHPRVPPSCVPELQSPEAEPETFIALVACPPCQLTAGPDHPKQPLSPVPAHPMVFLDGVWPPSLPHHELFNSQEQGAVAWAGGVGDIGVRTGREERSILSCPIASHPIWRWKVKGRLTSVGPAATTHQL